MPTATDAATAQVDVRGPRFTAWVTTAVPVITLIAWAFSSICLGCQLYPLVARLRRTPSRTPIPA
jgi:hypothetical protein